MAKPIVAVVGRPNVGKSTLFNKLIGQRLAIVKDTPGVTRDRIFAPCEWGGRQFLLADTGGIEPRTDEMMLSKMREQAQLAIDQADVIVLVTDLRSGVTANDADVASMLQKSGKPIVLCVNKCDTLGAPSADFYEFYNLGLGDPIAVSSVHGHGTGDLLDAVISYFPPEEEETESEDEPIRVAVIGKPNAGKSSLVNKIVGFDRSIVSDVAGTTRDALDTPVSNEHGDFIFIDTAGLRRQSKVDSDVEKYSILRAQMAIERADVCVIMIDGVEGFTEQDSKVAGLAHEAGKACIIAVNKWDAVEKDTHTMDQMRKKLENDFSFMSYAPFIFISAKTGQRLDRLFELIKYVREQNTMRISTGMLNDVLADATARVQPPTDKGRRLRIYYMTQASTKPPTFVCFVNRADLFHYSYQRYIENRIRETFGLEGTPVRLIIREKGENASATRG
ncbi:MAG: ribosome biogenesis GTPase Der [Clostridia bacterium]|nr:ribosome biogenesis GTPase Der [Clostridia bacterium]